MHVLLHSVPPTLQQATTDPHLHWRLLDTHRQVWVSHLSGHSSFFLGPSAQGSVCALQESIPQPCVSSGSSMVGLMATSSKRAYAIPRSAAPRAHALRQATADPHLHWKLLDTYRQVWVSLLWGHCSFLLCPGAQGSVCTLQESISQSCVNSGSSTVELMATSKRPYAIPKSAAPRAPVPVAVHC